MLHRLEVPVAYSMVELARNPTSAEHQPFHEFICYWTAFNNIYSTLAKRHIDVVELKTEEDGSIRTWLNGSVQIPRIKLNVKEREEILVAFEYFSDELKHELIIHPNTEFFVSRVPIWNGCEIEFDIKGQRVNGVIKIRDTVSEEYPIWSPIDIPAYERYVRDVPEEEDRDLLAKQIIFMLYSIRNNTVHAGKNADDANDREVIKKAIPLLSIVVNFFIPHAG